VYAESRLLAQFREVTRAGWFVGGAVLATNWLRCFRLAGQPGWSC